MIRVVKVGGSLLTTPQFVRRLTDWFANQPPAHNLVLFGGGEIIDAVRKLDQIHPMHPERLHWRCVELLDATFELATQWFETWDHDDDFNPQRFAHQVHQQQAQTAIEGKAPLIVRVSGFYRPEYKLELPETWQTTTDAIAGFLAAAVEADELRLLKACQVNQQWQASSGDRAPLFQLAADEIIDSALPNLRQLPKRISIEQLP